eukprot:COSAG01_NODE_4394_length_5070_cov_17.651177_1_plen_47_part_00
MKSKFIHTLLPRLQALKRVAQSASASLRNIFAQRDSKKRLQTTLWK